MFLMSEDLQHLFYIKCLAGYLIIILLIFAHQYYQY